MKKFVAKAMLLAAVSAHGFCAIAQDAGPDAIPAPPAAAPSESADDALAVEDKVEPATTEKPVTTVTVPAVTVDDKKAGSRHLQCDGNPNNMSAGEGIARFLGAVTLLGIFAPAPEQPDASKRKFGDAGVTACTSLIEGDKQEKNVARRLPLLLARAIHRIEAKHYEGAVEDVRKARAEAEAKGLKGDPYFDRSIGLSFDLIESEALIRLSKVDEARAISLSKVEPYKHSFYPLLFSEDYSDFARQPSDMELARLDYLGKVSPAYLWQKASRLTEAGRFAEAAAVQDDVLNFIQALTTEQSSLSLATVALAHALAGNWDRAKVLAGDAKSNMDDKRSEGKSEDNISETVEILDLYKILLLANEGKIADARRNFAARSEWVAPDFGAVIETNRRLREGAKPEELFGALEKTPDELWTTRRDELLAKMLERDKDNKTLFNLILPYAKVDDFERLSKKVWKQKGSDWLSKEPEAKSGMYNLIVYDASGISIVDAMLLHTALKAKERGQEGFTFMRYSKYPQLAQVRFGKVGDPGIPASFFINADQVIAELSKVIPTPAEAKLRKSAREKEEKKNKAS